MSNDSNKNCGLDEGTGVFPVLTGLKSSTTITQSIKDFR